MNRVLRPFLLPLLLPVVLLAACGKSTETAAEKMIESQMAKDGSKAKVDLQEGGIKIATTDASGKTSLLEMGSAPVSEGDVGVPFYPGTMPKAGESTRVSTPEGNAFTVMLHSKDTPDKVAAFYRDHLKSQATGKQFVDMSGAEGSATLMLADDDAKRTVQVHIAKADAGTDIQIVSNRATLK
jgi:hypothetical protein